MIRETVVDGEPVLDVDTVEDLDHTLTSGVYVLAPHDVLTEDGLTDTENSDTQDIVDGSDWRDAAWLGEAEDSHGANQSWFAQTVGLDVHHSQIGNPGYKRCPPAQAKRKCRIKVFRVE